MGFLVNFLIFLWWEWWTQEYQGTACQEDGRVREELLLQTLPTRLNGSSGVGWCNVAILHPSCFLASLPRPRQSEPQGLELFARSNGTPWPKSIWREGKSSCTQMLPNRTRPRSTASSTTMFAIAKKDESEREIHMASSCLCSHCIPQVSKDREKNPSEGWDTSHWPCVAVPQGPCPCAVQFKGGFCHPQGPN